MGRPAEQQTQRPGRWFLHCTAAIAGYQRQRFESEDRSYRQWALRLSPSPHILPRLQVDTGQSAGNLRYLEAVERDLEVAFGMSPDVRQQVYLLANGRHEANFWLGWHLASTFRRSRPLMAMSFVADQPAAPGTDSHAVIDHLTETAPADGPHRMIGFDVTRRRGPALPPAAGTTNVRISLTCFTAGNWSTCQCEDPHQRAIIAIDPEVDLAEEAGPGSTPGPVTQSPRMAKGIAAAAEKIGADLVLWVLCDGIGPSAGAYSAFLQDVTHAIHQHTAELGKRYIAYTGPVVLATLLGVHLANRGQWSFLAYDGRSYSEAPNPRAQPGKPRGAPDEDHPEELHPPPPQVPARRARHRATVAGNGAMPGTGDKSRQLGQCRPHTSPAGGLRRGIRAPGTADRRGLPGLPARRTGAARPFRPRLPP